MTSLKILKIIAGMPAYNEAKYLGTMVLDARQYVDEVIVINDGSSDASAKIAALAGASVINHERNEGYGAAILSIFDEARKRNPDILVILDADSQHNPAEIPRMIQSILEGADVVIGTRKKQEAKIPFYRRLGQKVISSSVNVLSENQLSDTECGFRAFSRKAVQTLILEEKGMSISAEIVAEASRRNLKIVQVPINVTYSPDSSTLNPVTHGLGVLARVLVMMAERRPLFFFGLAGGLLVLIGLAAGSVTITLYSQSRVVSTPWALFAVFFIILGVISIFNALTLNMMSTVIRQALNQNKR
jgi:glycosyltransferase involved in cell wall biosynthesis